MQISALAVMAFLLTLPLLQAAPTPQGPGVELELVAEGFTAPVDLTAPDDGSGRRFVVEQTGVITIMTEEDKLLAEPFLDINERMVELESSYDERGLLGLTFHPEYAENGRFFVYYSAPLQAGAPKGWDSTSRISEFRVSEDDPNRADPDSERILLKVNKPQPNHAAGQIAFGPDGYLYIPFGDGGGGNDVGPGHVADWYQANEGGNGQDVEDNLLGSILRIDVDQGDPYGIPRDNPLVGKPGHDEIWAYGFRNPFRIAFDAGGDHALFAGDVGQELWEEINIIVKGGNYGWNVREGSDCFNAENPEQPLEQCPDTAPDGTPLLGPIIEYDHSEGVSAIGGYVYRGDAVPEFDGHYLFGDWSRSRSAPDGTLFIAAPPPSVDAPYPPKQELRIAGSDSGRLGEFVRSFGQDADLELYILTSEEAGPSGDTGKVYKIVSGSLANRSATLTDR